MSTISTVIFNSKLLNYQRVYLPENLGTNGLGGFLGESLVDDPK
jgi:hypothetical protein